MAGYSIVLNLSGNAVSRTATLAKNLELANVAADSLAKNLALIGVNSRGINFNNLRGISPAQIRAGGTAEAQRIRAEAMAAATMQKAALRMEAAATKQNIAATKQNSAANRSLRGHSRSGTNPFASLGTSFAFGPFSGRLGQVFTPDENGQMFGVDAKKLFKAFNITGIATELAKSVGKLVLKSTLYPNMLSGGALMVLTNVLQSDFIAKGVALNSRRLMAQNVLGSEFEYANKQADFLAGTYGIDRGVTLGNISALTGLNVGNSSITSSQAAEITRIGGLIAGQSGAPIERVMTNLQQLLSQVNPNLRDIRELINQAPILGRYALKEMQDRGMIGNDYRTALKDRSFMLQTLASFALDNPLTPTIIARGQIDNAIANAGALLSGNNNAWGSIGTQAVYLINVLAESANSLITAISANPDFGVAINNIAIGFQNIGKNAGIFSDILWDFATFMEKTIGLDIGNREDAADRTARQWALRSGLDDPGVKLYARQAWESRNGALYSTVDKRDRAFEQWYSSIAVNTLLTNPSLLEATAPVSNVARFGMLSDSEKYGYGLSDRGKLNNILFGRLGGTPSEKYRFRIGTIQALENATNPYFQIPSSDLRKGMFGAYAYPVDPIKSAIDELVSKGTYGALTDLYGSSPAGVGTGDSGEALTGTNRDRRNLEIHFHAPLVDLTQNIQTPDPQETAEEVYDGMEIAVSAAIQKSLLGASEKMSSRWY